MLLMFYMHATHIWEIDVATPTVQYIETMHFLGMQPRIWKWVLFTLTKLVVYVRDVSIATRNISRCVHCQNLHQPQSQGLVMKRRSSVLCIPLSFSLSTAANWTWGIIVGQFVPRLQTLLNFKLYFAFAGFGFVMSWFVYFAVPETKVCTRSESQCPGSYSLILTLEHVETVTSEPCTSHNDKQRTYVYFLKYASPMYHRNIRMH